MFGGNTATGVPYGARTKATITSTEHDNSNDVGKSIDNGLA